MKHYLVLASCLVTFIVSGCQSSGNGEGAKIYPRSELLVSAENDAQPKDNTILVEGKAAQKVVQDFTYTPDRDGLLVISQVVEAAVNCEGPVTYKMNWIKVDGNGQEVAAESVVENQSQIKVLNRSNYLLRVELDNLKCFSYSLVFRVFNKPVVEEVSKVVTTNAGQQKESETEKNDKLKEEIKQEVKDELQTDGPAPLVPTAAAI